MILEEQVRSLESQLYPERIREITQQVQLQYQHRDDVSWHSIMPSYELDEGFVFIVIAACFTQINGLLIEKVKS